VSCTQFLRVRIQLGGSKPHGGERQAIYHVADIHDLILIVGDPPYLLQLKETGTAHAPVTKDIFSGNVPPYLSLDVSDRVLRLESLRRSLHRAVLWVADRLLSFSC